MSYILKHTAEELDYKLDLIDINKNLLSYPYDTVLFTGLEDAGDGSLVTTSSISSDTTLLTSTALLPAGTYTASIEVADALDTTVVDNPGITFTIVDTDNNSISIDATGKFTLNVYTPIIISLATLNSINPGLLIKPQIEVGIVKTTWVPYMSTISSYVDERFNSANTKIKALADKINSNTFDEIYTGTIKLGSASFGTTDLVEGESTLAPGQLYFVYED